jgi:receptor expression-enhancing protein 1/2/3/4
VLTYLQEKLRALWDAFYAALLSQASASAQSSSAAPSAPAGPGGVSPVIGNEGASAEQPTLANPVSGPTRMAWSLWQTYGPTVVARGAALLSAASAAAQNPASTNQSPQLRGEVSGDTASTIERRRKLEAELAGLNSTADTTPVDTPPSNNAYPLAVSENLIQRKRTRTSSGGSSSSSQSRTQVSPPGAASVYLPADAPEDTNGKYERINREDVEGDPLLTGGAGSAGPSKDAGGGWFLGWGRTPSGYEKVKSE